MHEALDLFETVHTVEKCLIDVGARGEDPIAFSSTRCAQVLGIVLAIAIVLIRSGRILNASIWRPAIVWIPVCLEPVREAAPADLAWNGLKAIPIC